jgi:monoamine oxidase
VNEAGSTQRITWDHDEQLYFNPGPARLSYHHEGILSYCRTLGVPLEVLCNDNRAALMQDNRAFDGAPQLNRRVVNDASGFVAELAAKAVDKDLLAQPVGAEGKDRLREFLRNFGALDKDLVYRGSARAGWAAPPGATSPGTPDHPLDIRQILASDFWQGPMQFGELSTMAATMLQPVGGMGRIGEALGRVLRDVIIYQAVVTQLHRTQAGVRITWKHADTGAEHRIDAPCVVVAVPFPALADVDADFAPATRAAIASVEYVPAGKVAFQATRRFWELDQQIYGGISWTSRDATQIWYPSGGLQHTKGILVGAYIWSSDLGNAFAAKPLTRRLSDTLDDVAHLHPNAPRFLGHDDGPGACSRCANRRPACVRRRVLRLQDLLGRNTGRLSAHSRRKGQKHHIRRHRTDRIPHGVVDKDNASVFARGLASVPSTPPGQTREIAVGGDHDITPRDCLGDMHEVAFSAIHFAVGLTASVGPGHVSVELAHDAPMQEDRVAAPN